MEKTEWKALRIEAKIHKKWRRYCMKQGYCMGAKVARMIIKQMKDHGKS